MSAESLPCEGDVWGALEKPPQDPIMSLDCAARSAAEPKANLVIGAYRGGDGRPYPFRVVCKADRALLAAGPDYEYLPMAGHAAFVDAAVGLLYGDAVPRERLAAVQTVGGTGAVYLGARLLAFALDPAATAVLLPSPTWPNHPSIFHFTGWRTREYRYLAPGTMGVDFEGMRADLAGAPPGSVVVLHVCAHNPTGADPTREQWDALVEVFLARRHLAFFDAAYHGFASGCVERDTYALRLFARRGVQHVCAQSFSKNMGLYGERLGTFSVALRAPEQVADVKARLEMIIRRCYTTPPSHGARLAHLILTDDALRREWEEELKEVSMRVRLMRQVVYDTLKEQGTPGSWEHIIRQIGMFSFLGLTKNQCDYCISHNVFITRTGRANIAGLTEGTAKMLAKVIDEAVRLEE